MRSKKQPRELLLKGGTVVDPFRKEKYVGDVFIKNGKIQKVGDVNYKSSMTQVDCSGLIVTHGFCDIHVHFREPGRKALLLDHKRLSQEDLHVFVLCQIPILLLTLQNRFVSL